MADGTRIVQLRRDVDGLKVTTDKMERSIEELKGMILDLTATVQNHNTNGGNGQGTSGDVGGESPIERNPHNWQNGYQIPTKCSRVEFPKFCEDDLRGWVYRCEQFFEVDETPSDAKVRLAAVDLEGKALQWHQIFMKARLTREIPNWEEYVKALSDRFGVLLYDDPMAELMNLKQTGNIQEYLDKFDELMNCVDLSENYAISCFLGGVKGEIAIPVRMFKPKTLQEAISLAKLQEQTNNLNAKKGISPIHTTKFQATSHKPPYTTTNSRYSQLNNYSTPHSNTSNPSTHVNKPNYNSNRGGGPIVASWRLSPQEMDEKRSKGLCFWCDEKFTLGHVCNKRKQLYILEVPENCSEEGQMEESLEELEEGNMENKGEEENVTNYHVSMNAVFMISEL
ncbi:hypothetical protein BUALT_Bualt09G0005900 [Buddleja alternifolia]|uniref:Retrotransposon gag domain-containing protein n=1 Tax=Buddleja alternifolia TaxID=168488 RepID=A0AAV6X7F7_9LAMI|nr:hypothetical protein BUALT_Bualt09G0005900 [Buddleja alternifolia]